MLAPIAAPSRDAFRPHALDGALLWFHPRSGTHVRWDAPATRDLRRTAPRVVMFGVTNRCNLACSFCSRDREAPSAWTVESAAEVLAGLSRRGTLEVAFGGGEPLAFRGFDELIEHLSATTALALHFTTNGALLTAERLRRLRPHVGEIRVSIYDDVPWEDRMAALAEAGGDFGANVLVSPERLASLPRLLSRLAEVGCRDVALLRYVGPDAALHLSPAGERALADIVAQSPLRTRLSVCFGDRLDPVPRLFDGVDGDCGAGLDFAVITSDKRLKACSFQQGGFPIQSADDVLRMWSRERATLLGPASLPGCARPSARAKALAPGVRVWQGFSGNNSGDCVLVGRFESVEDARKYVADLLPGYRPGAEFSGEWQAILEAEGIAWTGEDLSPESIACVGPTVLLHTDMAVADDFPALRSLLWKRGGRAVYSGVHEHDPIFIAMGMGFPDSASLEAAEITLGVEDVGSYERHGLDLYGLARTHGAPERRDRPTDGALADRIAQLEEIARRHGAVLAAEIVPAPGEPDLVRALSTRAPDPGSEQLWASFYQPEQAAAAAAHAGLGKTTVVGKHLLISMKEIPARTGFRVQQAGGTAELLPGGRTRLQVAFWRGRSFPVDIEVDEVKDGLRPYLAPGDDLHLERGWSGVKGSIDTDDLHRTMTAAADFARGRKLEFWLSAEPRDRLALVLDRLRSDLAAARRAAKQRT
jgi:MoaA/NifB/PqqE/SkfB family radical SAM enzyme